MVEARIEEEADLFDYDPYAQLATLRDFAPLTLTSDDFVDGGPLPDTAWSARARAGGADRSPSLRWSPGPAGTLSYAVSCFDPDAPTGSGFWHWAVANIDPTITELAAGAGDPDAAPAGAFVVPNERRSRRYIGSAPPAGTGVHRYFFVVDALDVAELDLTEESTPAVLGFQRHFHSLGRGILVGTATSD